MTSLLDPCPGTTDVLSRDSGRFLERNNECYEALLRLSFDSGARKPESRLRCMQTVAEFCQFNHAGRFADGALENVALDIGLDLERSLVKEHVASLKSEVPNLRAGARRHILHIATSILDIGGHTRTIKNWIALDSGCRHSLLVLTQGKREIPSWITQAVELSGGAIIVLPYEALLLHKALWVRGLVQSGPDLVILHTFGHDSVCPVALAIRECPPVALLNHADHIFWMGGSVADAIINQRRIGMELSEERRHARKNLVLPVPLLDRPSAWTRHEACVQLGIPEEQTILVSAGRACKYIPTRTHNFVRTAGHILDREPGAHLYLVGVSLTDLEGTLDFLPHPRLHFVGPVEDVTPYQRAADVYLEGFPFGSQTALLEAAMAGVPVVRAFSPPMQLLASSDGALDELAPIPASEEEYVESVSALISEPEDRRQLGKEFRRAVLALHTGDAWRQNAHEIYTVIEGSEHFVCPLPMTKCEASPVDIGLSVWQAEREVDLGRSGFSRKVSEVLLTSAYSVRRGGDFRGAFRLLCQCLKIGGLNSRHAMALLKLMPQRLLHVGRAN